MAISNERQTAVGQKTLTTQAHHSPHDEIIQKCTRAETDDVARPTTAATHTAQCKEIDLTVQVLCWCLVLVLLGYPRPSLAIIGVPWVDQEAKRKPFVVGVVLKSCGHGHGRRDVLS